MKPREPVAPEDYPHRIAQIFGERLRQVRRSKGISQEVFAKRLDVSRTTISNIECGRQRIFLDHAYKAAEILNVSIHELIPTETEVAISRGINIAPEDSLSKEEEKEIQDIIAGIQDRKSVHLPYRTRS